MIKKYVVALRGCDDSTYVDIEATDEEAQLLEEIAARVAAASDFRCQPTMEVKLKND